MQILIILAILIALLLFKSCSSKKDKYTATDVNCPQYGQWPQDGKCQSWIDFLSYGYPTLTERGNQANEMAFIDPGWRSVCSDSQITDLIANTDAYYLTGGYPPDIALMTDAMETLSKTDQCQFAKLAVIPPTNPCQLQDWKNNYMSTMTPSVQAKLNLWKSYGC